jgi:hypothetical protein
MMPDNVKKYAGKYYDIYQVRTLPPSGQLSMNQIQTEFGRGNDLGAYRGTQWWTDVYGQTGTFTSTELGIDQFYGKRGSSPPPPYLLSTYLNSGEYVDSSSGIGTITYRGWGSSGAISWGSVDSANLSNGNSLISLRPLWSYFPSQGINAYQVQYAQTPDYYGWNYYDLVGVLRVDRASLSPPQGNTWRFVTNQLWLANGGRYQLNIG